MVFFGVSCVWSSICFSVSFLSSDFKAVIQFTCWFLLTHPGQRRRRHSGDSSYWRRPRDGGRQNKRHTQEVHEACTYGTTHLFNTQRIFVLYVFCLIFFVSCCCCLVVKFWFWLLLLLLWVCSHWKVHLSSSSRPCVLVGRRGCGEDPPIRVWWVFCFCGGVTFI